MTTRPARPYTWLLPITFALSASSATAVPGDRDGDGVPDGADAFPCDALRAGVSLFPSEGFGTLLYEDNWPSQGDLDFNDAVVAFNVAFFHDASGLVTGARLTVQPRAAGASIHSGLALRLPIPRADVASVRRSVNGANASVIGMRGSDAELVVAVVDDLHALFGRAETWVNTTGAPTGEGPVVRIDIELARGVALGLGHDPVDLFFFRTTDPGHEVHRSRFGGTSMMRAELFNTQSDASSATLHYVDGSGLPYVIALPSESTWPRELVSVEEVWPRIVGFAASGGASDADFYEDDGGHLAFDAGPLATVVDLGGAACPAVTTRTVRFPFMVGGNYGPTGTLGALGANYVTGDYYGTEYRSWFAFDVSQELGTVVSAALVGGTVCSPGSGRPLALYDLSTPVVLLAQNARASGFNDMGTGTQLGGLDFTGATFPATFSIPLNAAGLTALQGSVGNGDFRIGARYGMGAGLITPCAASERAQLEVTFQN